MSQPLVVAAYAEADRNRIAPLVSALEANGLEVIWGPNVHLSAQLLSDADCILIFLSQNQHMVADLSRTINELTSGPHQSKTVGVLLEDVRVPLELARIIDAAGEHPVNSRPFADQLVIEIRHVVDMNASEKARRSQYENWSIYDKLLIYVDEMELSVRSANIFRNESIVFVGDLVSRTEAELLRMPNAGRRTLNETKAILSELGLHLGMYVPNWPPTEIGRAAELAKWSRQLAEEPQAPLGAHFKLAGEYLQIDASGNPSDLAAALAPLATALQAEVRRKAEALSSIAGRMDNQAGWKGLGDAAQRLRRMVDQPPEEIPSLIGYLYGSILELGSFLELDNKIVDGRETYSTQLDAEIRRPLDDLVRTAAPWLRQLPSVQKLDEETGGFLSSPELIGPTRETFERAILFKIITEIDATTLNSLVNSAERGDFQGRKAATRGMFSARNLIVAAATLAGSMSLGAISSDVAVKSELVKQAGNFIVSAEAPILIFSAGLSDDMRLALEGMVREFKKSAPEIPDTIPIRQKGILHSTNIRRNKRPTNP